jgi:hypothetical protein
MRHKRASEKFRDRAIFGRPAGLGSPCPIISSPHDEHVKMMNNAG